MTSVAKAERRSKLTPYVVPFAAFILFLAPAPLLKNLGDAFWLQYPEHWLYPLQTLTCALLLWHYWREYELHRLARLFFTVAVAVVVFLVWIAPQAFLGFEARTVGFNPEVFDENSAAYWATICLRFLRLVIVVPLVEEIFWRGFLLRYLINEKFAEVPFGTFSWFSFGAVTIAFTLAHSSADWVAAAICGMLFNLVAYHTRSLTSCILAHALTNLLLGLWILTTKQWGFW